MNILENLPNKGNLQKLWTIFPMARLVGGVVRDLLVKKSVADIDIATPDSPDMILQKLQNAGIKAIPTGIAHGTITAILNHCPYEITTLRRDVKTDGRHAAVEWTDNWQEDAARRDFTINALYCDQAGKIWDFYQGQEDLLSGKVRFIGVANERIKEDFLRILRFFRFYARYGQGRPDSQAVKAIQYNLKGLKSLSAERIWSELQKIIIGPRADEMMGMMDRYGVLPIVIPFEYSLTSFNQVIQAGIPAEPIIRLAGLIKKDVVQVAKHLKLSRRQGKFLAALHKSLSLSPYDTDKQLMRLKANYDLDLLIGKSWLEQAKDIKRQSSSWNQWRARVTSMSQPVFPLTGKDLLEFGIPKGPIIGEILQEIRKWWLEEGCNVTKEECIEWFKNHTLERINQKL